jgi:hypothetical protein
MARQTGLIKIKGTLDNVNFYKTKDGDLARMKTSVDADRIKNDPAYIRTRENNAEFGNSSSAGKLLRDTIRPMSLNASDGRVTSRMTKIMTQIKNKASDSRDNFRECSHCQIMCPWLPELTTNDKERNNKSLQGPFSDTT